MSPDTPDNSLVRRRRQYLALLESLLPPTPATDLPPVSDELDQLLWLFAEDLLPEEDEKRLEELASREPAARGHFQAMLASLAKHDDDKLSSLPPELLARAGIHSQLPATRPDTTADSALNRVRSSLSAALAEVCVRVAREFLVAPPHDTALAGAMARGEPSEQRTSVVQQILKRTGIYQIVVDHTGEHRCQLTIRLTQASDVYAPASIQLELHDANHRVRATESLAGGVVRFRDLSVGGYVVVFLSDGLELDRMTVLLEPAPTE